nr:MAG TPA: hypothetical protein [Caudoviricetes sp.]
MDEHLKEIMDLLKKSQDTELTELVLRFVKRHLNKN